MRIRVPVQLPLRFVPGWRRLLLVIGPLAMAVAIALGAYLYSGTVSSAQAPAPAPDTVVDLPAEPGLLVHVIGAVENPGLYRLPRGDREQIKVPFAKSSSGTVIVRVNLNQATLQELETIPGFTPAFAAEVIDYRTNFGGFQNTRELVEILGMSETDYVIARKYVTL
jgi:competence protein ComEA